LQRVKQEVEKEDELSVFLFLVLQERAQRREVCGRAVTMGDSMRMIVVVGIVVVVKGEMSECCCLQRAVNRVRVNSIQFDSVWVD